ncbi:MAG: hypothetical protein J6U43_03945, partial [Bacteroidales bacterium]|nr:hypothetical protein [Bacteroidales bacterium]
NATLHVVENCKSAYEKASAWRYFLLIVEDLEVGSGVQDAWAQNSSVRAYGDNGDIVVTGCNEGDCIAIYN